MKNPNALMVGTGEYTTGYVHGEASSSDKSAGVVALSLFDLAQRGKLGNLSMVGTNGSKFPAIRDHLKRVIGDAYGLPTGFDSYPADEVTRDTSAFGTAIEALDPGDMVTVFTPDNTHFDIAMQAVRRGCHVLIAKPIVKTVAEHKTLLAAAEEHNVLVAMEVHKRWDPIYLDARDQIRGLGDFSYFSSYMSQPKSQLETFRSWAGISSDISYYLNAHHIDFNVWAVDGRARPVRVYASAAKGVAQAQGIDTEDTINLLVTWQNENGSEATASYTASWIAPKSDVHSQQAFFYMGQSGEVRVDQAHRGYGMATDAAGYRSPNPLFMKYTPDADGRFAGQSGYGYRSIEAFVDAVREIRAGNAEPADFDRRLATIRDTLPVTQILEAGRASLDEKRVVELDG